jgi:hypothetical protein
VRALAENNPTGSYGADAVQRKHSAQQIARAVRRLVADLCVGGVMLLAEVRAELGRMLKAELGSE